MVVAFGANELEPPEEGLVDVVESKLDEGITQSWRGGVPLNEATLFVQLIP